MVKNLTELNLSFFRVLKEKEAHVEEEELEDCGRLIWNAKPFPLKALGLLESFVQKFFPTIFIIDSYTYVASLF